MPEGFIFGLIDNGVLAFATILGIDIDKYFKGSGVHGAIYGALIGNSLSDFLGAVLDFPLMTAINITLGCLIVIPVVWFVLLFKKWALNLLEILSDNLSYTLHLLHFLRFCLDICKMLLHKPIMLCI